MSFTPVRAFDCPRCSMLVDPVDDETPAAYQVARCPFCAENGRRIAAGKRILQEPTPEFPTATAQTR